MASVRRIGQLPVMRLGDIGAERIVGERIGGEASPRRILSPVDAARLFGPRLADGRPEGERLWVALLDAGGRLLSLREEASSTAGQGFAGSGGGDSVTIPVLLVLRNAVRRGAEQMLIAHDHPSGDPAPSRADIHATRRLCDAASATGIGLLDHIIVARGGPWCSFRLMGLL